MPSGKQMLLHLLRKYSQEHQSVEDLDKVSEDLRIGLLLHGSTPDDMWFNVERMAWITETDIFESTRQGLGVKGKNIFLSDIFEYISEDEVISKRVLSEFPDLTKDEYQSSMHIMWLLLISVQFFSGLSSVENNGVLDKEALDKFLKGYRSKLKLFREDPADFLGLDESFYDEYMDKLNKIS